MVKSAKYTGSRFRAVKLCLQSKGHQHQCSQKGQRKQNWKPPRLHSQFTALLPKSIWDLSKRTGHWHRLDSWTSPPRPRQLAGSSAGCQRSHKFVLSPSPHPAKKMLLHQKDRAGWREEQKIAGGHGSPSSFLWGQSQEGRTSPPWMLARAGQLWGLREVTQWQRQDWPASLESDILPRKAKPYSGFPHLADCGAGQLHSTLGPPPLYTCSHFQNREVACIVLDLTCIDHRTHGQQQTHLCNPGVQSHSLQTHCLLLLNHESSKRLPF